MKIAFLSNKITLRGTEVNLYDYAHYNETILKNESVIITRPYDYLRVHAPHDISLDAYKKFEKRFPMYYYINPSDIKDIVQKNNIDVIFIEKSGEPDDGLVFDYCKTIVHAVFNTKMPHGSIYTAISDTVNKMNQTNVPVLPNMVNVYETSENMRRELNIPENAIVFGTYSGADAFDIDYVRNAVIQIGSDSKFYNIYFVFMNVIPFTNNNRTIFLEGSADMKIKRKFINTCDAMLYGRKSGETFGLACGEFSLCNKPIIACSVAHDYAHLDILGDSIIKHNNYYELYNILTNWHLYNKDVSNNGYKAFIPENVIKIFKDTLDKL